MIRQRCPGCMEILTEETMVCPKCGYVRNASPDDALHMLPGTILGNRYIMGKTLGYGGFGVTYLAWDGKLQQKVAIKEYMPAEFSTRAPGQNTVTVFGGEKSEQFRDGMVKFIEEAKKLARFQNEPGIVKVFDSFEENGTAYIVMEYLEGMTLSDYLKQVGVIGEDDAVGMLMPVMRSLQVVHSENILHRDISPDNIFVTTKGELKLIDFGAARFATTSHSRSLTVIIKPGYSPEEQYRSRGDQGPYTDVYALSATLYKMITGTVPPDAMERRAKYEGQNKDILTSPHKIVKGISVAREIAILNALNVKIEDRTPDIETFINELEADPPAKRRYGKIKKIDLYTWPMWLKITLGAVLAALLLFGVFLATGVIKFNSNYSDEVVIPDNMVAVPDVEGLSNAEAVKRIEDSRLIARAAGNVESQYVEAGKIVLQNPSAGLFMEVNGAVMLIVSKGTGEIIDVVDGKATVPYVIWEEKAAALEKLELSGLGTPGITESYDDNVAEGLVVSQSIEAGTQVDEGTVIDLVISLGPKPFDMPDVVGNQESEADTILKDLGLSVKKEYKESSSAKEGTVLEQSIEAGTSVVRGTEVTITVATKASTIKVENVVGKNRSEAKSILEKLGFKVKETEEYNNEVTKDVVISQTPASGTEQTEGTVITLVVSKGRQEVKVNLDATGGNVSAATLVVAYGGTYGSLPEPDRAGYYFGGWYTDKEGGALITSTSTVSNASEHTLYARWSNNQYTVNFDGNGGTVSAANKKVAYASVYGELPTATRTGHTFDGWYTAQNGGERVGKDSKVAITTDQTLYAHWTALAITVSFDANGGSVTTGSKTVKYGEKYGELPVPAKAGYGFNGWFTAASGGKQVNASDIVAQTAAHTLYAQWTAGKITVAFNGNGGEASKASITVNTNSTYGELPTASRAGYTFDGWYTAAEGGSKVTKDTRAGANNVTVYAHWSINSVTVTVIEKGDNGTELGNYTLAKDYGTAETVTPAAHTGYTAPAAKKVTWDKEKTITFTYTANSYTVTIAEKTSSGVSLGNYSISEKFGTTKTVSPRTYTGYTAPAAQKVTWDKEKTITFTYTANSYTVTIAEKTSSGVSLGNYSISEKFGTTKTVSPKTYTGYTAPAAQNITWDGNKTVTFTYTANTYTLSFNGNGGSNPSKIKVTYGAACGNLPVSTRDYYTFDGWYTSATGGTKVTSSTVFNRTSNATLYAHWTENAWEEWSSWSTTPVSAESSGSLEIRQIESRTIETGYRMGYYLKTYQNYRDYRSYQFPASNYSNLNFATMPADKSGWVALAPGGHSPISGSWGYNYDSVTGYYMPGNNVVCFILETYYETQYRYIERIK